MPKLYQYQNFDLAIQGADNTYSARVLDSPGGQSRPLSFSLPFSALEIENLLLKMGQARARIRGRTKNQIPAAQRLGGGLYEAVFREQVRDLWISSLNITQAQKTGLRLRLRLNDAPDLADLPWELLYDASQDTFFNHSIETPLVRYLELPAPTRPLKLDPPLKILVMISLPDDVPGLDAEQEWENLNEAVQELDKRNLVKLERTQQATLSALLRQLRRDDYHVLHFIGHGAFDTDAEESVLLLEGESERAKEIDGQKFGTVLHDHRSLRLVLLNACEGARSGPQDPFSGVAQKLIQQGIPAVVAMQFAITDRAAITFSRSFYESLSDNYPIDAAVSEARKAIYAEEDETTEWATPVLYLRAPDGVIFDLKREVVTQTTSQTPSTTQKHPFNLQSISFDELVQRALDAQKQAERILADTPNEIEGWRPKFQQVFQDLERANTLQADDPRVLLPMAQVLHRLNPQDSVRVKDILRTIESMLASPQSEMQLRILADAYFLHATLTYPPNQRLLDRATSYYVQLNDQINLKEIEQLVNRLATQNKTSRENISSENVPTDPLPIFSNSPPVTPSGQQLPLTQDFNPLGKWSIQVQDMVGSRLLVEFASNGTFQMIQQVGKFQVPVNGSWNFNPLTKQLSLQGVVNTFQPFILAVTISGRLPTGYAAVGSDGIGYVLTRA